MKRWLYALLLVLLLPQGVLHAQLPTFGNMPVDIVNADQTYFENGVAIAEGNVIIQYGETTIYADYGQYHTDTHDVFVTGHVRIYREGEIFVGERAVYNLETKKLHAANFQGDFYPFRFSADSISSIGTGAYLVRDASFTTSDSSTPDYQLRAKSARIYTGQRIILRNVTGMAGCMSITASSAASRSAWIAITDSAPMTKAGGVSPRILRLTPPHPPSSSAPTRIM